jgi:hypothetical protein
LKFVLHLVVIVIFLRVQYARAAVKTRSKKRGGKNP